MIFGSIINGIKRIIEFKILGKEDLKELVEIQNNLLARLSSASKEASDNILKVVREIDKIMN